MRRITSRTFTLAAVLILPLLAGAVGAAAQTSDESRGAQLLRSVQQGQTDCGDLTTGDFELIGESWMGQMFVDSETHDAMDRMMASMMGARGEDQMHEYMGRRVSDCGGGSVPPGIDRMMNGVGGMMGMIGMMGGGQDSAGMMGGGGSGMMDGGYGSMMGGGPGADDDDDHVSGWGVAAVILLMVVFLGALFFIFRAPRAATVGTTPTQILQRRFAAGEITRADYERRLRVLGGER